MNLHPAFVVALLICVAWSTFFSMFSRFPIRGYRNFGFLAAYICFIVFLFVGSWESVALTWGLFAVAGALIYFVWELLQRLRSSKEAEPPTVHLPALPRALLLWPVMIPEALEYCLAEFGILKPVTLKNPQSTESTPSTRR